MFVHLFCLYFIHNCVMHMVMRNKKLMILILISLMCYCILQCILYVIAQRHAIGNEQRIFYQNDKQHGERPRDSTSFSQSLENLRVYVAACHQWGIPVTVVDTAVLGRVQEPHRTQNTSAQFFRPTDTTTQLATVYHLWQHDELLLLRMKELGFSVLSNKERDDDTRNFLALEHVAELYTHYLFQRGGHMIHQIVFIPQQSGYLWFGKMMLRDYDEGVSLHLQDMSYIGQHTGVVDSFEAIKVTLDGLKLRVPRFPTKFLADLSNSEFIQCNYTRQHLFQSRYGHRNDEHAVQQFRGVNRDILAQAKAVLDRLGIRFWLSSGTCLGWYRQCDAIHYSGDVDIGIWINDYQQKLIPAMIESGLLLKHVFGKEADSYELSFENHEVKLDIFFFYEEEHIMWNGGTQAKTGQKFKYIFPSFTLCWTEFLELKVQVPCETEQYLEANYGADWFIPVESWDWKSSPPNVVENGYWSPEERDQVIIIFDNS